MPAEIQSRKFMLQEEVENRMSGDIWKRKSPNYKFLGGEPKKPAAHMFL
jgi:hypothetical protein